MFDIDIGLKTVIDKLFNAGFADLVQNGKITLSNGLEIFLKSPQRFSFLYNKNYISLKFEESPWIHRPGFFKINIDIEEIKIFPNKLILVLDNFPDITLNLT